MHTYESLSIGLVSSDFFDDLSLCDADLRTQVSTTSNNGDDTHNGNYNEMIKKSVTSPDKYQDFSKSQN
jgi:hypothetical protein